MSKQNKGLGRGLDAVLQADNTKDAVALLNGIAEIPLAAIETNPYQPRTEFEEEALKELAASIKEHGIIQPVTVRTLPEGKYQLISGGRRFKACQMLEKETITAYIRSADDEQMLEMALVENLHRRDLNPLEIGLSYRRLIEECNLTQDQLSVKVSKDRSTISNFLRLLKLPDIVQYAIKEGNITMGHAKCLMSVEDENSIIEFLRRIIENKYSVRETEELIANSKKQTKIHKSVKMPQVLSAKMANFKQNFESKTGLAPKIVVGKNGKGTITIPFKSEKNIETLMKLFE